MESNGTKTATLATVPMGKWCAQRCGVVLHRATWVPKVEAGVLQAKTASPSERATAL